MTALLIVIAAWLAFNGAIAATALLIDSAEQRRARDRAMRAAPPARRRWRERGACAQRCHRVRR